MNNYFRNLYLVPVVLVLFGCGGAGNGDGADNNEVNVYSHRHYETDEKLFEQFENETGINVNVVNASADELIRKLELEGEQSPADVLITVDAGRLYRAREKGLLQAIESEKLNSSIPPKFREPNGYWYGLTYRARVIAYHEDRVDPESLSTYEDLASDQWEDKILIRSSGNIYNQSLLASLIVHNGREQAKSWAASIVDNMAREPKGGDRDQIKAVAAGQGDIAIVNTYYLGKLLNSENEQEVEAGNAVEIFFPNQEGRGSHVNVSGAGVTQHAPHKENAIRFLEFLASDNAQETFAKGNYEYPVKEGVDWAPTLESWGEFKADTINLSLLGKHNEEAVRIFDQVGWK